MSEVKTISLTLVKKNRMYFAAKNAGGYDCKVRITAESEGLEIGKHDLLVEDWSIRSKYGTDLIYVVKADIKETGIVTLQHFAYNSLLVQKCRDLGGKWDADQKAWIFSSIVNDKVEALDVGFNETILNLEITAKKDVFGYQDAVEFNGYRIAIARGRDSGAKLADGVSMISGEIDSSGSVKNWNTKVAEGSVFRLKATDFYELDDNEWSVKVLTN